MTALPFPRRSARAHADRLYVLSTFSACRNLREMPEGMDSELFDKYGEGGTFWGSLGDPIFAQKVVYVPHASRDARRVAGLPPLPPAESVEIRKGSDYVYVGTEKFCHIERDGQHLRVEIAGPVPAENCIPYMKPEHLRWLEGKLPPKAYAQLLARTLAKT
jgi:hypothetical protein